MVAKKRSCACFIDLACGNEQYKLNQVLGVNFKFKSIVEQERISCRKRRALVSVDKWMVFCNAKQICRSQFAGIRIAISRFLQRPCQCGFEHSGVSDARRSAMQAQLFGVKCFDKFTRMKACHLASAR